MTSATQGGNFTRAIGIILLCLFVVYMVITVRKTFTTNALETGEEAEDETKELPLWKALLLLVIGAVCIAFGADFLVIDIPVMLAVMLIMTVPALIKGRLSRFQGISLLVIYTAFCVFQFAF